MKHIKLLSLFLLLICSLLLVRLEAQDQGIYFDGSDHQWAEFDLPSNMPTGTEARTIEFWIKIDSYQEGTTDIISLGKTASEITSTTQATDKGKGLAIRITTTAGAEPQLAFWSHENDISSLGAIPDDQWHFVAIVLHYNYQNRKNTLKCYINGKLQKEEELTASLSTPYPTTCKGYLWGHYSATRSTHLEGTMDEVTVWDGARSEAQIKDDMILHYGDMSKMVLHFGFESGANQLKSEFPTPLPQGTASPTSTLTKTLSLNGASVTQALVSDPQDARQEGVWYIIQNKADVATDIEVPARALALKATASGKVEMENIPLTGDYREYMWALERTPIEGDLKEQLEKTEIGGSVKYYYQLRNRKYPNQVLISNDEESYEIQTQVVSNSADRSKWLIHNQSKYFLGNNAFEFVNLKIENKKLRSLRMRQSDEGLSMHYDRAYDKTTRKFDEEKIWMLQPMRVQPGYHISLPSAGNSPTNKHVVTDGDINLYASNTVSEWAMLNAQNIIGNISNTIKSNIDIKDVSVYIMSVYDQNHDYILKYPYNQSNFGFAYRGGARNNFCLATEEVMCTIGGKSYIPGFDDRWDYKEFEQLIHEFGHVIDREFNPRESETISVDGYHSNRIESYAECFVAWFNNGFSQYVQNRLMLKRAAPDQYNHLTRVLNINNTWLPPRNFRLPAIYASPQQQEIAALNLPTEINSPYTLEASSAPTGSPINGLSVHTLLQSSYGNNILYAGTDANMGASAMVTFPMTPWLSVQDLGTPYAASKIKFIDGQLIFYDQNDEELGKVGLHTPQTGTKLVLDSDNFPRNQLKIIDEKGKTLWRPEIALQGSPAYRSNNRAQNFGRRDQYDFGAPKTPESRKFWLRNTGVTQLKIKTISIEPKDAIFTTNLPSVISLPKTLEPQGGFFFDIQFSPGTSAFYNSKAVVSYDVLDAEGNTTLASDKETYVFLTGKGTRRPNLKGWEVIGDLNAGQIYDMQIDATGKVYLGGTGLRGAGTETVSNITRWDPATQTWDNMSGGVDGSVEAIAIGESDKVYVGGGFHNVGGDDSPSILSPFVASFSSTSGTWSSLGLHTWEDALIDENSDLDRFSRRSQVNALAVGDVDGEEVLYVGRGTGRGVKLTSINPNRIDHNLLSYTSAKGWADLPPVPVYTDDGVEKVWAMTYNSMNKTLWVSYRRIGRSGNGSVKFNALNLAGISNLEEWNNYSVNPTIYMPYLFTVKDDEHVFYLARNYLGSDGRNTFPGLVGTLGKRMMHYSIQSISSAERELKSLFDIESNANWHFMGSPTVSKDGKLYAGLSVSNKRARGNVQSHFYSPFHIAVMKNASSVGGWGALKIQPTTHPGLEDISFIEHLAIDDTDNLFALFRMDPTTDYTNFRLARYTPPLPFYDVAEQKQSTSSAIWISGEKIWQWDGDNWVGYTFDQPSGITHAQRIEIDAAGFIWILDQDHTLRRLKANLDASNPDNSSISPVGSANASAANGKQNLTDIAIHTASSIWAVTKGYATSSLAGSVDLGTSGSNHRIQHFNPSTGWNTNVSGGGIAIDIENDTDGTPWIVTAEGKTYRYIATANTWQAIALPTDVKALDITDGGQGSQDMFVLGDDGYVYRLYLDDSSWNHEQVPSQTLKGSSKTIRNLSLTHGNGLPWVMQSTGQLFTNDGEEGAWKERY